MATTRSHRSEHGFTLTELLIVIVVMGILAGVVVFAMSGVTSHAQSSACTTENQTISTAEDAYFAKNTAYATTTNLVTAGYLKSAPLDYQVRTVPNPPTSYTITVTNANPNKCS